MLEQFNEIFQGASCKVLHHDVEFALLPEAVVHLAEILEGLVLVSLDCLSQVILIDQIDDLDGHYPAACLIKGLVDCCEISLIDCA